MISPNPAPTFGYALGDRSSFDAALRRLASARWMRRGIIFCGLPRHTPSTLALRAPPAALVTFTASTLLPLSVVGTFGLVSAATTSQRSMDRQTPWWYWLPGVRG